MHIPFHSNPTPIPPIFSTQFHLPLKKSIKMGCVGATLADAILFAFFLFMAMVTPWPLVFNSHYVPQEYIPKSIMDLKTHYTQKYGDYLVAEKPDYFMGLVWMQLFVVFPLSILNLFALLSKSRPTWFNTTCLIHGVCVSTSLVAILSDLLNSGRASERLRMAYCSYLGFALLAVLRGVIPATCTATTTAVNAQVNGKKPVVGAAKAHHAKKKA